MSFQPRLPLPYNTRRSDTGVAFIFKSPAPILDALDHVFGSRQQDAHVLTRNRSIRLDAVNASAKAATAAVNDLVGEWIAQARAERGTRR